MEILDQPIIEANTTTHVKYAGFWKRLAALLIDGVILSPITFGFTYFNITNWKNPGLFVFVTLLGMAYKPVMEYMYGATLGKMALKLKVVTQDLETADVAKILLRNVFHLAPAVLTLLLTLPMYFDPEFGSVSGVMEYTTFATRYKALQVISPLSGLITFIDAIVMIADDKRRSLHDKIAGTSVIDQS